MQQQTCHFSSMHILPEYSETISLILFPLGLLSEFHQTSMISIYSVTEVCQPAPDENLPVCSLTVTILASFDY